MEAPYRQGHQSTIEPHRHNLQLCLLWVGGYLLESLTNRDAVVDIEVVSYGYSRGSFLKPLILIVVYLPSVSDNLCRASDCN
jgi:hypothetical protein